jgi:RNA polymerase sigma-70 factor (ECF subfamily)
MTARERFEVLYGDHAGAVLAYARRRTTSGAADDVVAETFLVAWRRLEEVPIDARWWLLGVARGVLANQRRGQLRQVALRDRLIAETPAAQSLTRRGENDERVVRALQALSDRDREALLLLGWEALSSREAALVLGIREQTYRVRLHRARKRFAHALAAAEASPTDAANPSPSLEAL